MAAKPQATQSSWYENQSRAVSIKNEWTYLTDAVNFDKREGFVTLSGDTFTANWTGFVKVSGLCNMKIDPARFVVILESEHGDYHVIDTPLTTGSFVVTVPAGWMKLKYIQQNEQGANGIRCNLLFEAVK